MRVLVTNDDGWEACGLLALTAALVDAGHDVVIAAPAGEMSGAGAGVGPWHLHGGVAFERVVLPGFASVPAYSLDGPPALCVMAAMVGAFGDAPDVVASGVNPGCNTGRSVLHSGTVGAALTAANLGGSAVAVSQESGDPWFVETAAVFGAAAIAWVGSAPPKTVLNVNVPNLRLAEVTGIEEARLAPFGTVRTVFDGEGDGRLDLVLRATNEVLEDDTDTMVVRRGRVAVTSLVGVRATACGDAAQVLAGVTRATRQPAAS